MKIAFYTLGCKVNQYETQALESLFAAQGFTVVDFSQYAEVYVINTCTVTALSDKKSRTAARRGKKTNPNALLVVCGCYAQVEPEEVKALCGADLVIGNGEKGQIVPLVQQALTGKITPRPLAPIKGAVPFEHLPPGGLAGRTRALLKVQDGCQNFCSYCKIPYARGVSRSLPLKQAVADALEIARQGYKELVITGIEISSYGFDLPEKPTLAQLIYEICLAVPYVRVRLGSLEPRTVTPDFVSQLKDLPNLCPHFHLSLQSGCDKTLLAMNRKYDTARYEQSVCLLSEAFLDATITTDLIVGFPGESHEDFVQSLAFLRKCGLSHVHIFPFSRRVGTKAYSMEGQLEKSVKEQRAHEAANAVNEQKALHLQNQIGKTFSVLFEQPVDQGFSGLSRQYYTVFAQGEQLHNQERNVKITHATPEGLIGEII